jgi:hypothetical protein
MIAGSEAVLLVRLSRLSHEDIISCAARPSVARCGAAACDCGKIDAGMCAATVSISAMIAGSASDQLDRPKAATPAPLQSITKHTSCVRRERAHSGRIGQPRRITQFYDRLPAPSSPRTTQFSILAMLRRSRPMTINALAAAMVMEQTTLGTSFRWSATVREEKSAPRPNAHRIARY